MSRSGWPAEDGRRGWLPGMGSRVPKGKSARGFGVGFFSCAFRCLVPRSMDLVKFTKMSCGTSRKMWMSLRTMSCLPCSAMVAAGVCRAEGSAATLAPENLSSVSTCWTEFCQTRPVDILDNRTTTDSNGRFPKPTPIPPRSAVRSTRTRVRRTESRAAVWTPGSSSRAHTSAVASPEPSRDRGTLRGTFVHPPRQASFRVPNEKARAR